MSQLFAPIGETSRREMFVAVAAEVGHGEIVPYEALEMALGLDRTGVQSVAATAKSSLQRDHRKSLVAIPNVGYRVLLPSEHMDLAKAHQKRGRRQTRKSKSAVEHTDYSKLTPEERLKFDVAVATVRALELFEKRADLRYASRARVESFMSEQSKKNERTDDEVLAMKERLARLEALIEKE